MIDDQFRTGVHRHYKGGLYTALMLVTHHETRQPIVIYVSHTTGTVTARPLRPMHEVVVSGQSRFVDCDAWDDWVMHDGNSVRRFTYVGEIAGSAELKAPYAHRARLLGFDGHCSQCGAGPGEPCRNAR